MPKLQSTEGTCFRDSIDFITLNSSCADTQSVGTAVDNETNDAGRLFKTPQCLLVINCQSYRSDRSGTVLNNNSCWACVAAIYRYSEL